jgi:hypothetical protein
MRERSGRTRVGAIVWLSVAAIAIVAVASINGDTIADRVLGQGNFSQSGANFLNSSSLNGPGGVAIDKSVTPNRLYIADFGNSRVLGYKDVATLINGGPADLVIGQPDFLSSVCNNGGLSASSLCNPASVGVDADGNLYVGDRFNNRVLEYNTPFAGCGSFPCVGVAANLVFGQGGSFTSNTANNGGVSANSLSDPFGVVVDASGNLYVADIDNSRILEYDTPLTNSTADRVFGQGGSFTSNTCNNGGVSASSLCNPVGVALDAGGDLYIADFDNSPTLITAACSSTTPR